VGQGAHDLELESSGDRGLWTLAEARLSLTVYCISVEFALLQPAVRVRKSQARLALARSRNMMGVQLIIGHFFLCLDEGLWLCSKLDGQLAEGLGIRFLGCAVGWRTT
jgi:hypothetical protein